MSVFEGYRITSPYGNRRNPLGRGTEFHAGIDLVKAHQAPIKAFTGGEVLHAGWGQPGTGLGGYGNVVVIKDRKGSAHIYGHLDSVTVKKGQKVKQGQTIGRQGKTPENMVTGSHLHYEVRKTTSPSYGWTSDKTKSTYEPTAYLKTFYAENKQSKNGSYTTYTVKAGDNLTKIAAAFNTTVDELVKLNNIKDKNLIVVGQKINIPQSEPREYIKLPASAKSWLVYKLNRPAVAADTRNHAGRLSPSKFGGLEYEVLEWETPNVVAVIQTRDFGKVKIFVDPKRTSAKIIKK